MSALALFDTHCHLDLPELAADLDSHWLDANAVGVQKILVPATEAARWPLLWQLKSSVPQIEVALGVHPWWSQNACRAQLDDLAAWLARHPTICAVGEIGLDYALDWHPAPAELQQHQLWLFREQLAIAAHQQKPVILHHRKSQPALLAELKAARFQQGGILHAFSGSQAQAHAFLDLGFKLGIGGTITYPRAEKTRRTVSRLPLDALVLETDAPSMPLLGLQGQPNTPARLPLVLQELALLRRQAAPELALQLWQNSLVALQLD